MAMIKCPECEKEISDKAKTCPKCGYDVTEYQKIESEENYTFAVKLAQKYPREKINDAILELTEKTVMPFEEANKYMNNAYFKIDRDKKIEKDNLIQGLVYLAIILFIIYKIIFH